MNGLLYDQKYVLRGVILITILYSVLFAVFISRTAFSQGKIILSSAIIGIQLSRYFYGRFRNTDSLPGYFLAVLEFLLLLKLFFGTQTNIESIVFAIYTIDIILFYRVRFGVPFAYVGYAVFSIVWDQSGSDSIDVISGFNYCVFIGLVWGTRVLLQQRDTIYQLNQKILEQSAVMEDLAMMKERNRIAEEVHNAVGHKLTTAIVSLEGAHLLFGSNPREAHQKLNVARKQLKDSLSNIREVVRTLDSGDLINREGSLRAAIDHLIADVEKQTGAHISFHYNLKGRLLSLQEHVLLNAVKEGITNAIRHAGAERIDVSLIQSESRVELKIDNDGRGSGTISEGFGLNAIRENAEAIGGKMEYVCKAEGFILILSIPAVSEE